MFKQSTNGQLTPFKKTHNTRKSDEIDLISDYNVLDVTIYLIIHNIDFLFNKMGLKKSDIIYELI